MNLSLITPPVGPLVDLDDLKQHLRVDHDDDDTLIESLEAAAASHLDGPHGLLGRAILPQVWTQDFGPDDLAVVTMPDAQISAEEPLASGGSRVTFTAALPEQQLPVIVMAVKLLVAQWYDHRANVAEVKLHTIPKAVDALIGPLRVHRI